MGVKNLWDVLESCKKTLPLHHLQNKRLCIDLSCWMVRLYTACKTPACVKDKVYLTGLFHRLRALLALNCSLILVSDGSIPAIKIAAYRRRLNKTSKVLVNRDVENSEKVSQPRSKGSEFACIVKEAKILGLALGIPCLDGIEEGEAQCGLLNAEGLCDGCFSSDSDIFLFGARTVYRDICIREGYVVCYEMSDIETKLGFGRNSLITLALILGSDYTNGVHGLGRESACRVVKSIGDKAILQKVASEGLSFAKKKTKGSKKSVQYLSYNKENTTYNVTRSNQLSARDDLYLEVIDAYLKPKCHSADSDDVHTALVQHPYEHVKVQQVCAQYFLWPTEITDEYILPKIAERELRRFNNLRSTSSKLGVKLLLDKIPTKCPISEIIKERRVHGQDYYEVSWDNIQGLKTSLVPADLIQSACPEKIVEFKEEMARKKKKKQNQRKPRVKKSEEESSLSDIERNLQNLLLDTESKRNIAISLPVSSSIARETASVSADKEWDSFEEVSHSGDKYKEVIDLLSPSPPKLRCRLEAKQQASNGDRGNVEVLEISDSENEFSPEHVRKARELRVFLAAIKD